MSGALLVVLAPLLAPGAPQEPEAAPAPARAPAGEVVLERALAVDWSLRARERRRWLDGYRQPTLPIDGSWWDVDGERRVELVDAHAGGADAFERRFGRVAETRRHRGWDYDPANRDGGAFAVRVEVLSALPGSAWRVAPDAEPERLDGDLEAPTAAVELDLGLAAWLPPGAADEPFVADAAPLRRLLAPRAAWDLDDDYAERRDNPVDDAAALEALLAGLAGAVRVDPAGRRLADGRTVLLFDLAGELEAALDAPSDATDPPARLALAAELTGRLEWDAGGGHAVALDLAGDLTLAVREASVVERAAGTARRTTETAVVGTLRIALRVDATREGADRGDGDGGDGGHDG